MSKYLKKFVQSIESSIAPVAQNVSKYEAELILMHVTGLSRSSIYLEDTDTFRGKIESEVEKYVRQRLSNRPLAYILGHVHFFNHDIFVNSNVLIPRPETEILVETILNSEPLKSTFFCDTGTGSGAITAALIRERPRWRAVASDISLPALKTALTNIPDRTSLLCMDCLTALKSRRMFDFTVSNPPYIKSGEIAGLDIDVRKFEPLSALDGGPDGLKFFRRLAEEAATVTKPSGHIYCETGDTQAEEVCTIFKKAGWKETTVRRDLAGRQRVFSAKCP
jgi:release factor glutamine methyltransferase